MSIRDYANKFMDLSAYGGELISSKEKKKFKFSR